MRKYLAIAAAALALLSSPASADWTGKNAAGATITFSNPVDCTSGTCIPIAALVTAAGATLYGTAGSSNTAVLSVQGIASGTALPISGTVTATPTGTQAISAASASYASGAFSSGAFASGAVASGAFASGSIASGAMAAGSHAAGSGVDGWDLTQGAIADAAVTAGATGSVSAKLRSISRDVMTVNTWAGGTLGAMAAYGTSPGAVNVPGVNAYVTNTLSALTPGDGVTTGTYASGSPVFGNTMLWNGTTYDRWKSAGSTGIAAVATTDPCQSATVNSTPINISTATTTRIATEASSVRVYICHLSIVTNAANNVALIEGTGSSCAGGTPAGMAGGTTASSGWNFSANGGISLGMGGYSINQTLNTNYSVCLVTSAATQLSGVMKWVAR